MLSLHVRAKDVSRRELHKNEEICRKRTLTKSKHGPLTLTSCVAVLHACQDEMHLHICIFGDISDQIKLTEWWSLLNVLMIVAKSNKNDSFSDDAALTGLQDCGISGNILNNWSSSSSISTVLN